MPRFLCQLNTHTHKHTNTHLRCADVTQVALVTVTHATGSGAAIHHKRTAEAQQEMWLADDLLKLWVTLSGSLL